MRGKGESGKHFVSLTPFSPLLLPAIAQNDDRHQACRVVGGLLEKIVWF